jgi:hypothetical protein
VGPLRCTVSGCCFHPLAGALTLELGGAEIAQSGVYPPLVVYLVDKVRQFGGEVFKRLMGRQVDGLYLERLHEV